MTPSPRPRPSVVAHRGASDTHPEHTLAAYQRAIEVGADGLECDVRLSADGHLVCVHDRRVDRTSSGSGLVSTLPLAHLEALDWGAGRERGRRPVVPAQLRRRLAHPPPPDPELLTDPSRRMVTLRGLFTLVADAPRRVEIAVETKHPTRWSGGVERALADLLTEFGWDRPGPGGPSPVRMMSFSRLAVRRMRLLSPQVPTVQLLDVASGPALPRSVAPGGAVGISVRLLRREPGWVRRMHEQAVPVHVWTVDEPADVRRCLAAGVAAIITNRPAMVLAMLAADQRGEGPRTSSGC